MNFISHQMEPANNAFFKRIALELMIYARENDRAYSVAGFLHLKGIGDKTWTRWLEKHPHLKECHEEAAAIMCQRRETGAMERKLDGSFVKWTLPMYSKKYKEYEEWRSNLNKDKEESGSKIVVIEKFVERE